MFNAGKYGQSAYSGYQYNTIDQTDNAGSYDTSHTSGMEAPSDAVNSTAFAGESQPATASSLPHGWQSGVDPQTQNEYYIHGQSGHTQWEKPEPLMAGWSHAIHKHGSQKGQLFYYNSNTKESRPANQRPEINRASVAGPSTQVGTQTSPVHAESIFFEVPSKRQSRIADCWYAAMQMLLSWKYGQKTKPTGDAIKQHRKMPLIGNMLSFDSSTGAKILEQNGFKTLGSKLDLNDIHSIENILQKHGPFMICGKFNELGFGHNLVVCGVKTSEGLVGYMDPAYGGSAQWRKFDYFNLVHKYRGSDNPTEESIIVFQ